MKERKTLTRFVGIDLGKRTYEMAVVGKGGKVTMSNGKTYPSARQGLYNKLRPGDKVALEACSLAFIMAKEIEAAVRCKVYVLNPGRLSIIYKSMKKTDKEDALKLAHILEDFSEERLPVVAVPSDKEMERRKILANYRRADQNRTRNINLLHALFVSQGITTVKKSDLETGESRKETIQTLAGMERDEAEYLVKCLALIEERKEKLDRAINEEAANDEEMQRLREVPGVGPKVAFAFVSHVGAARFENASQLSNYLGLVPRVYMSGDTVRYGPITKRGNSYVRALLVQGAWALVRSKAGGKLKERYEYMTIEKSKNKKKAIVAAARQLAEMMYTLMRDKTEYEYRKFKPVKESGAELAQLALSA